MEPETLNFIEARKESAALLETFSCSLELLCRSVAPDITKIYSKCGQQGHLYMISGLCCRVDANCAILGY